MWGLCDYLFAYLLFFVVTGGIVGHLVGSYAADRIKPPSAGIAIGIAAGVGLIMLELRTLLFLDDMLCS